MVEKWMAANVQCMCRSGAYEAAPCPTHPNEIMKLKLQCNTVPRYGTCTLLWPVPSPLSCLWKSEPSLKSSVPTFILLRAGRKCFVAHWLVRVAVFPCTFSLFIFSIVLAVHWSGYKMFCCLLTCLRCSFPPSPTLFLFCQSSSLSIGAGRKCLVAFWLVCVAVFPLPLFSFCFVNRPRCPMERGRKYFVTYWLVRVVVFLFPFSLFPFYFFNRLCCRTEREEKYFANYWLVRVVVFSFSLNLFSVVPL